MPSTPNKLVTHHGHPPGEECAGRCHGGACDDTGCSLDRSATAGDLPVWWREMSEADMEHAVRKAQEYGSADLEIMGTAMQALLPSASDLDSESRRRAGLEMAIGFYALGKASRLFGAFAQGREPSDDTWHDLQVYAMMARRIRETGRWP